MKYIATRFTPEMQDIPGLKRLEAHATEPYKIMGAIADFLRESDAIPVALVSEETHATLYYTEVIP